MCFCGSGNLQGGGDHGRHRLSRGDDGRLDRGGRKMVGDFGGWGRDERLGGKVFDGSGRGLL